MVFPEKFDTAVVAYSSASGEDALNIEIYYNLASNESSSAYMSIGFVLARMLNNEEIMFSK